MTRLLIALLILPLTAMADAIVLHPDGRVLQLFSEGSPKVCVMFQKEDGMYAKCWETISATKKQKIAEGAVVWGSEMKLYKIQDHTLF